MDKKEFQKLAIRTESIVEQIQMRGDKLSNFISLLILHSQTVDLLDKYKKNIFYGEDIDEEQFKKDLISISHTVDALKIVGNYELTVSDNPLNTYYQLDIDPRVFHALLGTITEHGEISEALSRGFDDFKDMIIGSTYNTKNVVNVKIDLINICEELGDSDWYKALFYEATNISWDTVQEMIIKKLEIRFADKIFTEDEAKERDLVAERELLNSMIKESVDEYESNR